MFKSTSVLTPFASKVWLATPTMHGEELQYMKEAYDTNWMSTVGKNINEVEAQIASLIGVKYAVALSAGTAALHLATKLAGEHLYGQALPNAGTLAGHTVFCSDVTFDASINPIAYEDGEAIFLDTEYDTWNTDPKALKKAIEMYPDVKLYVMVHLYGTPGKVEEIKKIPNVSEAILKEYAQLNTELNNLMTANANYDRLNELKAIAAEYAETRDRVIRDQLFAIESDVNQRMREVSESIFRNEKRMPPVLRMVHLKKYTFDTPNDGGTGAQYRGLITFDLANLDILPLPFVVHDSPLLKNIEKRVLAEIIRLYAEQEASGKQVFIAFDMLDTYTDEMQKLLRDHLVLELSPGGNELFGRAWNKETETENDGE